METFRYSRLYRPVIPDNSFLGQLREAHRCFPEKIALIEEKKEMSFFNLWRRADRYAAFFRRKKVAKGKIVVIVCPMSSIEVSCMLLALMEIEAVPLILNLADKFQKLQPEDAKAFGFVIHKDIQKCLNAGNQAKYCTDGQLEEGLLWCRHISGEAPQETDAALLVTSSGSTNRKKIIRYGMEGLTFNIRNNVKALKIRPTDRTLMVLPLTYSYGLVAQFLSHLSVGATIVFSNKRLMTNAIIELISRHEVTSLFTAPPVFRQLVFLMERFGAVYKKRYSWPGLRYITVGGNHIEAGTVRRALEQFNCAVVKTYGLAEAGPRVASHWVPSVESPVETNGRLLEGVKVHVYREDGSPAAPGETGLLTIETPSAALGYLFESENCLKITGQYIQTNDYGSFTADGQLRVLGRKDNALTVGTLPEPVFKNDLADLLYTAFYIMKLQIVQLEEGKIRVSIASMPGCKPAKEEVLKRLEAHLGSDLSSFVEITFPKIGEIKIDK